jgi:hypothetical protein
MVWVQQWLALLVEMCLIAEDDLNFCVCLFQWTKMEIVRSKVHRLLSLVKQASVQAGAITSSQKISRNHPKKAIVRVMRRGDTVEGIPSHQNLLLKGCNFPSAEDRDTKDICANPVSRQRDRYGKEIFDNCNFCPLSGTDTN